MLINNTLSSLVIIFNKNNAVRTEWWRQEQRFVYSMRES